jgi:hypothetical protein
MLKHPAPMFFDTGFSSRAGRILGTIGFQKLSSLASSEK